MKYLVNLVVLIAFLSLGFAAFGQQPQQIAQKASDTEADVQAIK